MQQLLDDRSPLNAAYQSWAYSPAPNAAVGFGNGTTGLSFGRVNDAEGHSDAGSSGNGREAGSEAISTASEPPPSLSEIGYSKFQPTSNKSSQNCGAFSKGMNAPRSAGKIISLE